MIKLYIFCPVLIIGNVEVGQDIGMKFHQEVMEIVSYDIPNSEFLTTQFLQYVFQIFTFGPPCLIATFQFESSADKSLCPYSDAEILEGFLVLQVTFQ